MKVTICELSENEKEFEADWNGLVNHTNIHKPALVLLPELAFSKWIASEKNVDENLKKEGVKKHEEWHDAETWYYRGNGAVDIISDKEFTLSDYKDRGVILYGNKNSNEAWKILLDDCPIQVERIRIIAGNKIGQGDDLSAYFIWPIRSSNNASVGVIVGAGLRG